MGSNNVIKAPMLDMKEYSKTHYPTDTHVEKGFMRDSAISQSIPSVIYHDDCLSRMDWLIEKGLKVDMILCDLPYGTTQCKWDSIIPFDDLWERCNKLIKPNGAIVLFGNEPFSSALRMSNIKNYKYDWVWKKSNVMGFLNANKRPLKEIENIMVFNTKIYQPQGLIANNKWKNRGGKGTDVLGKYGARNFSEFTNYPRTILEFKNERGKHPTQKPVPLLQYLIRTYTNDWDIVLDNCMGSGSTGVACGLEHRRFVGIEKEKKYYDIASERIDYLDGTLTIAKEITITPCEWELSELMPYKIRKVTE